MTLMFEDEDADWVDVDNFADVEYDDGEGPNYEVTGTEPADIDD